MVRRQRSTHYGSHRAFTGRDLILKFEGAYHGHHDYSLHGLKPAGGVNYPVAHPDSAGIPQAVSETILIAPYNDIEATRQLVASVGDRLAAIIVEPVQRSLMPRDGFLAGLRELCDQTDALLVFDEVVTGFRIALGGAQEAFGVAPDLCALGKVIGGGLPLAAVAGRRDILELTIPDRPIDGRSVYVSGTLNGNPLAAAAGLATLDVIVAENTPAKLAEIGGKLAEGFVDAAQKLSVPLQMIGPPAFADPIFGEGQIDDYRSYAATNRQAAKEFGIELLSGIFSFTPPASLYVDGTYRRASRNALQGFAGDAYHPRQRAAWMTASLSLAGVRIVEACQRVVGPFAGWHLAMLGATVVKVEPLGGESHAPGTVDGCLTSSTAKSCTPHSTLEMLRSAPLSRRCALAVT